MPSSSRIQRDDKFNARIGSILASLRGKAGLSQVQLSEKTGIKLVRISRLESGLVRLLAEEIPVLCAALGVGTRRLLEPPKPQA